jgi:Mycotoxin biosynthesis protein UstYa
VIYIYLRQLQNQADLRYDFNHVLHCLDSLRADVLCAADDTPIAVGNQPNDGPQLQVQTRKCRDWGHLEEFVTMNSACFQGYEPDEPGYQTIEEWQHCQKDSPYWATVQQYLLESGSS